MRVDPSGLQDPLIIGYTWFTYHPAPGSHTVTPPSFWETLIPLWGPQRALDYHVSENDGWGILTDTAFFILDLSLIGDIESLGLKLGANGNRALKAANVVKMAKVAKVGLDGERAVRALVDIGPKFRYLIDENARIADGMNRAFHAYSEVKNVAKLSKTKQIVDGIQYARQNSLSYNLYVRKTTELSGPLLELERKGQILIHRIL